MEGGWAGGDAGPGEVGGRLMVLALACGRWCRAASRNEALFGNPPLWGREQDNGTVKKNKNKTEKGPPAILGFRVVFEIVWCAFITVFGVYV